MQRTRERADGMDKWAQNLIDRVNENGKDTAALNAFDNALKEAHSLHESAKGIINSHQGFDADGKVSDHEIAVEK
jgi:hypothetical protein